MESATDNQRRSNMLTYDPIYLLIQLWCVLTLELSLALVVMTLWAERAK